MNITLPRAVSEELESISKELGSKKSHIITQALELYFDELDLEIAKRRLEEFENGETDTISADEVWKDLGID
jgi:predicted DNA-binding protein